MHVIEQTRPQPTPIPGVAHATWAGAADGLQQISLWRQTLAPGAETPPHSHDCDEVVLCERGTGTLLVDGRRLAFSAGQTLVLPRGVPHQIVNGPGAEMDLLGIFGATPVGTFLPDGQELPLPWRT